MLGQCRPVIHVWLLAAAMDPIIHDAICTRVHVPAPAQVRLHSDSGGLQRRSTGSEQHQRDVGCYWYPRQCVEPGMALTNRNISDLPLHTCTYLDLGNLCFFNVTAEGTLNWDGKGGWAGQPDGGWRCKDAMDAVVADVLEAKRRQPNLRAYYELWDVTPAYGDSPSGHAFVKIFSNATLRERFVSDRE